MHTLFRFLSGYVRLKIVGKSPERFLNLCRNNHIFLWDIRTNDSGYYAKICRKDFKKIKPYVKKTKIKVVIIEKCGLPFFMFKNRKRKIFFVGVFGTLCFLYFMTGFLWSVTYSGNQEVTDDMLDIFLQERQIRILMPLEKIEIKELEKEIRKEFPVISWVSVRLNGTKLVFEIRENDLITNSDLINSKNVGKDIIAATDGKIISIITRSGTPFVKKGDMVKKNDILVEGAIPVTDDYGTVLEYHYVEADADIIMEYRLDYKDDVSRYYKYRNYSGKEKYKYFIKIGSKYLTANILKIPYEKYEIWEMDYTPQFIKNMEFPIKIGKKIYKEYEELDNLYDDNQAILILEKRMAQKVEELKEKGVIIMQKNVRIESDNAKIIMVGDFVIQTKMQCKKYTTQKPILIPKESTE